MRFGFALLLFVGFPMVLQGQNDLKQFPKSFQVEVYNPLSRVRGNVLVHISGEAIRKSVSDFNADAFMITDQSKEIPGQYNQEDEAHSGITLVLEVMQPREKRKLIVNYNPSGKAHRQYTRKTQAELSPKTGGQFVNREYIGGEFKNVNYLRVPPEHKDHSWYIRYEGPGWESDKVGYRFYLDQRNAIDVFGKKTTDVVLQGVGLDGFESYHHMQPWGMDVMKVGKSLGLGSIGKLENGTAIRVEKTDSVICSIPENGPVYSSILTQYFGWQPGSGKYDLQSLISIHAGTRLSHHIIKSKGPVALCTGIVKDKTATVYNSKGTQTQWGYLATYGKQSLNSDELGLVVFFNPSALAAFTEDDHSNIISFTPLQTTDYYFAAAWVQEPSGIRSESEFLTYINQVAEELAQPVSVNIIKRKK